jgi:hypothetical protein
MARLLKMLVFHALSGFVWRQEKQIKSVIYSILEDAELQLFEKTAAYENHDCYCEKQSVCQAVCRIE